MKAEQVDRFLQKLPPQSQPESGNRLGRLLVKSDLLTAYQVEQLLLPDGRRLVLGNVVLQQPLASGGMGEVFRGYHRRMKRNAVVKMLHASVGDEAAQRRFEREIQAAARLSHPHIITTFDADQIDGAWYMVMEYVEGVDLATLVVRSGPLPVAAAISYVMQAARGLGYAHSKGVIHRDVKPSNILVDSSGVVKVFDLGLARFEEGRRPQADESLTGEQQIVGTVEYMAPEQARGGNIDRRCDIYGLGCTLHRLLTGSPPYVGSELMQVLVGDVDLPFPALHDIRPDCPLELETVFQRMIARRPADRYRSMKEVLTALKPIAAVVGVSPQPPKFSLASLAETQPILTPDPDSPMSSPDQPTAWDLSPTLSPNARAPELAIGIDLGTTHSALAYLDEHGRPQTANNMEGDKTTPSAVFFDGPDVIVGKEAVKAMGVDALNVAETSKRDLGFQFYHKPLAGREFPPQALEAWILNKLRVDAERTLGPLQKAVITVPAYFDEVRRKATQDAGYIAGFEVLDIINEPTAAALAFGFRQGYFEKQVGEGARNILVYDLGGGTFDVTVMEIDGNRFKALATDGDWLLGGRDWDQRLIDFVAEEFIRAHGLDPRTDPNVHGMLWRECEDAKRTLTARQKAMVTVSHAGRNHRVEVSRKVFQEVTQDLLDRTLFTTRQTLQAANLEWPDLDRVLLVGGSTRMPAVVEALRKMSGKEPDCSISPDEAVAHGAALYAGLILSEQSGRKPQFLVQNVNSHSLGVIATNQQTGRRQTSVMIPRNTPLPVTATQNFTTSRDNQKSIHVQIVEGESKSPEDCYPLGACTLRNLPPNLPAQTRIAVRFHYETNGRLEVTVKVDGVDNPLKQEITRSTAMTSEQIDSWRQFISGRGPGPGAATTTKPT
ncbi:Chaperone protein DnaK [Lignipirellula cremea]|uniref:Chaperone protein DnaK n=2 Tax=Lignipirellula cremea TaxID=2528010 RepID=A0A518DWB8_9BACT|nr:Chaperone protein DnaK [Lignipirellula cremea]